MGILSGLLGPPSEEKFAEMMQREARRQGDSRTMRFDPQNFSLALDGGDSAEAIFLGKDMSKAGTGLQISQSRVRRASWKSNRPRTGESCPSILPALSTPSVLLSRSSIDRSRAGCQRPSQMARRASGGRRGSWAAAIRAQIMDMNGQQDTHLGPGLRSSPTSRESRTIRTFAGIVALTIGRDGPLKCSDDARSPSRFAPDARERPSRIGLRSP
jgi:hypothetical protein